MIDKKSLCIGICVGIVAGVALLQVGSELIYMLSPRRKTIWEKIIGVFK